MLFQEFKGLLQAQFAGMVDRNEVLFITGVDKDELWETYLDSYPKGSNEIFRKRREHDCSCCRQFIRSFGGVVVIEDNRLTSIWDFDAHDPIYQTVMDALSARVKSEKVQDVFVTTESGFGTDKSYEQMDDTVHTWHHFRIDLPRRLVTSSSESEAALRSPLRDVKNVFQRSLGALSSDAVETVLDLIAQNSLYKGEEWAGVLTKFLSCHQEYRALPESERDNYCWKTSVSVGGAVGKIRNHSIGVLLSDISDGIELDTAVRKYEAIVAPTNYKRPKAIFTKRMIEDAEKKLTSLGLLESLGRRFATIGDITVNDILFANRDSLKSMGGVFDELKSDVAIDPKTFGRVEEVPAGVFVEQILPRSESLEVLLESSHASSLVSLVAPKVAGSPSMFKWNNCFSWAYEGNITDSMKQRVKAAGGNVEGVLRFSIQWNDEDENQNDFDAHCWEPDRNHIYFPTRGRRHPSTGMLDVDIVKPKIGVPAVENITWTDIDRMQEGLYTFSVHNFSYRGGRSGFKAEIEYRGQIYSYEYDKELRQGENVVVAELNFSREKGLEFVSSLKSSIASKTVWGLSTNQFHSVSTCLYSPNHWEGEAGIGHRHYFFILKGCINEGSPNGFFNEFLREDLSPHKRVFEALGGKMRVEPSEEQLSGVGFSSTKRNSVICRLGGNVTRTIKVIF